MDNVFDALEFKRRAQAAGFTEDQAYFQAHEIAELLNSTVVTHAVLKQELAEMETRMRNFHFQVSGTILGSLAALITILESIFHLVWRG